MKLIFFIFSLSLVLWSRGVQAYSFTIDFERGFYWSSLPISLQKFAIDDSEGIQLEAIVQSAEDEWENRLGREIWDIESGYNIGFPGGGNFIRWSNNFAAETGFDPNTTLAVTVRQSMGTHIVRTEIILNGHLSYLRNNWSDSLRKTMLHELGHTVGLGHSDHEAIMGDSISSVSALKTDDIKGMDALLRQTYERQGENYISPYAGENDEQNALACGSVDMSSGSGGNSLFSLALGAFFSVILLGIGRQNIPLALVADLS